MWGSLVFSRLAYDAADVLFYCLFRTPVKIFMPKFCEVQGNQMRRLFQTQPMLQRILCYSLDSCTPHSNVQYVEVLYRSLDFISAVRNYEFIIEIQYIHVFSLKTF